MTKKKQETVLCEICKEQKEISEVLSAEIIREPIVERIKATHPYAMAISETKDKIMWYDK
jgi:precorrin-6x reductase